MRRSGMVKARLGMLSLGLGLGLMLLNCLAWVTFLVAAVGQPGFGNGEAGSAILTGLGVLFLASVLGHLVGVGAGIGSLVREDLKVVAILGIGLNALVLLGLLVLVVLSALGASV